MGNYQTTYTDMLIQEINTIPEEYLPTLLGMVRLFRESLTLTSAEISFEHGWQEAMTGATIPVEELWADIDAE